LTVALDGTCVRANSGSFERQHYVVAGRIDRDGQLGSRFAWIALHSTTPVQFIKAALDTDGWTSTSRVAVLTDGADGLKTLVNAALPQEPRSILDWFHVSLRLRPIEQMGPKVAALLDGTEPDAAATIRLKLPRLRHQMWNGKWHAATNRMRDVHLGTDRLVGAGRPVDADHVKGFRRHLVDLRDYLRNNWTSLTDYREARRDGLWISSAPAESGMSHLVNQRIGKRQPMCWSSEGAHLLLQVRCAVFDDRLDALFREWHPRFRRMPAAVELPAM
jgi:hypothetical protein